MEQELLGLQIHGNPTQCAWNRVVHGIAKYVDVLRNGHCTSVGPNNDIRVGKRCPHQIATNRIAPAINQREHMSVYQQFSACQCYLAAVRLAGDSPFHTLMTTHKQINIRSSKLKWQLFKAKEQRGSTRMSYVQAHHRGRSRRLFHCSITLVPRGRLPATSLARMS
jgi:hypothetical protein